MGRGLMLFLVGMIIMMGMYNHASHQRLLGSQDDMVRQVHYSIASSSAMSGMEAAAQTIIMNSNELFRKDGDILPLQIEGATVEIELERAGSNITLLSRANSEGVEALVTGRYRLDFNSAMPDIDGAMGIYSDDLIFNMTGNAFEINGCDHLPQNSTPLECNETYGIAVHDSTNQVTVIREITGQNGGGDRSDRVIGNNLSPSVGLVDNDGSFIDKAINEFLKLPHTVIERDFVAHTNFNGSRDNPKIIRVTNGATFTASGDNSVGSGVIIIEPGATLHMNGSFDYEGLIIVQGKFEVARGNLHLYGALLFGGANPEIEVQTIDYRGNINIRYSSQVLDTLDEEFGGRATNRRLVLLEQFQ
ncbi:MAG: hypothetical protein LAT84_03085 [Balneolia bacterium]|nr:hypothetical protein [Balneolia bacterium]